MRVSRVPSFEQLKPKTLTQGIAALAIAGGLVGLAYHQYPTFARIYTCFELGYCTFLADGDLNRNRAVQEACVFGEVNRYIESPLTPEKVKETADHCSQ